MTRLAAAVPLALAFCYPFPAQPKQQASSAPPWTLAQSSHFEVFSQTTDQTAPKALLWFEQMRVFFSQDGLQIVKFNDQSKPPLRIIGFRSEKEYDEYRLRPFANAYFASDGGRDYIVASSLQSTQFRVAAHEYSHYVSHTSGLKVPTCLEEGLAEVFSTLQIAPNGYWLGGNLPARAQALQANRRKLLPPADLFAVTNAAITANTRKDAELFYAESWALADMLSASPKYAARFRDLISELNAHTPAAQAFARIYNLSFSDLAKDLATWIDQPHPPHLRPVTRPVDQSLPPMFDLSLAHTQFLLAQLMLVSGHVDQAKSRFANLSLEQSNNPDVSVALGTIALRQGNRPEALNLWRRAIKLNVQDPELCYRYALLADEAGLDPQEIKLGLERAVLLSPAFDDARYRLALVQYHLADYRSALENLRKMDVPKEPRRRYAYWTAMATSLLELNENDEAVKTAHQAADDAQNEHDHEAAMQIAYVAATDMNVQFATDADGRTRMVTTRIPHGGATDWNPFIQPSDQIQHANGRLSKVLCTNDKLTGFQLQTTNGATVTLDVADPSRVLMRNSPNEFYCGPMRTNSVEADYAVVHSPPGETKNILRGMTFPK